MPEYQHIGIGKELVSRMIESLRDLYMVDLLCDEHLQQYYKQFGMSNATGSCLRNYDNKAADSTSVNSYKVEFLIG